MNKPFPNPAAAPLISVIMANFNGGSHIRKAIQSVLAQTHQALELIVSDDGSQDQSIAIVEEIRENDDRVRLIRSNKSSGPAGARNRAIEAASGAWVAVVDSDDIIHPERLARMLAAADTLQADMVADDLIFFAEDLSESAKTLFQKLDLGQPEMVDALALVEGRLAGHDVALGYAKPLIRRATIGDIRYDTDLRVDEDHDFYLRLLLSGATFALIPDAMYLYRRHAASLSHRFSVAKLQPMIAAQKALLQALPDDCKDLRVALARRIENHRRHLNYARFIDALAARQAFKALGLLLWYPTSWPLLANTIRERATRKTHAPAVARSPKKIILSAQGGSPTADFALVPVPDVASAGAGRSAAATWANLARLSCEHDLHIIAVGRAGAFALGLVPFYGSARVVNTCQDIHALIARDNAANQTSGAAQLARSL